MSTSEPYGDVQNVITRVGADPDNLGFGTHDRMEDFVEDLLARASHEIDAFLGRRLRHETEKTVDLDGNNRGSLKLPDYPVTDVASVTVNGVELDDSEYRVTDAGILKRRTGVWPGGWGNIELEYDHGYEHGVGAAATVAEEMVIEAVNRAIATREADGKTSVSMDGYSVSFDTASESISLTGEYRERLAPYRDVPVV